MEVRKIAILSVHTSPLASLGSKKAGGMNVYIRELAQEFSRQGIQVDIYTRRTAPDMPEIDNSIAETARVIHVNAGPPQPLDPDAVYPHLSQFTAGVIAFATRHGEMYDLIYSHYWLSGWVAQQLKELWSVPFVHMFHTLGHMKNRISAGCPSCPDVRVRVETQVVEWADRIVAATPAEYAQLLWLYRADRRKIAIIPPGVNAAHFRPLSQHEAKRQLGIAEDRDLLLFVGRIEPLKAVDTILEAIDRLRSEGSEYLDRMYCAIIGGSLDNPCDRELAQLKKLAGDLKLDDVVEFLGAKDHQLLPVYYSAASAVIVPSDYESFGMVALEAMASGTPVIASEVGGLAFLVRHGETGLLFPVRDSASLAERIKTILADPEKTETMGANAAHRAQQYVWSSIAAKLLTIFEDVLAPSKSTARA
jgi:D-inositol-3-phosphate glycosyltransferase